MPSLGFDLVRRVERLPKPIRTSDALQPLFEAISNSIHSVQDKYKTSVDKNGTIEVLVTKARKRTPMTIVVSDNGVGLDDDNFEAFCTTDTGKKVAIGGKGVGRLLWLDCFEHIHISSRYLSKTGRIRARQFDFVLSRTEQIENYSDKFVSDSSDTTGVTIKFTGLRDNGYRAKFPSRLGHIFRHMTSHFLPTFIGSKCPKIVVTCDNDRRVYPDEISEYIFRTVTIDPLVSDSYGAFKLIMMECDKVASADLSGRHFIHFIAHHRTVRSQSIDSKLGIKYFGSANDRVFHACLFGKYLDKHVNQERTDFVFEDSVVDDIVNNVCILPVEQFLADPLSIQKAEQAAVVDSITGTYPSVAFGNTKELQEYIPAGELSDDAIFGHLSRQRFRRDQKQAAKIRDVMSRLKGDKVNETSLTETIREATSALEDTEQKSLAEYVIRRKAVLDLLTLLIQKVRIHASDAAYQREDILHSFICPMKINTTSDSRLTTAASHDLWILDERLTFAQYFSSDVSFDEMASTYGSEERPDLLVFDTVHGLRASEDAPQVLLVEFKRPGRTNYNVDENPQQQVEKYIRKLLSGAERDYRGRPIRVSPSTIFYCYVVADRLGKLEDWTYSWSRTADGRGRIYQPRDGFLGSIELVEWDSLIRDARARNAAFFDKAGISGDSFFSTE